MIKRLLNLNEDLGLLVDFLAELFKVEGHKLIGHGMPRVGKLNLLWLEVFVHIKDGYS